MALTINIKKVYKPRYVTYIVLCTLCLILTTLPSSAQEKNQSEIQKSKNTTTINGAKFYLHIVEKGQTLFAIAKCYDINLNDIVIENPEAIDGILPGQELKIPAKKAKKPETTTAPQGADYTMYKVEAGQTLYSIAKQHTTVEKIKAINPDLKDGLKGGQNIKIPLPAKQQPESEKVVKVVKVEKTKTSTPTSVATEKALMMGPLDSASSFQQDDKNQNTSTPIPKASYTGELKKEYNIAFFLPFNADEANQLDIEKIINGNEQLPSKSAIALPFYEGILLAIDSLKKQKLNAKIFVYDIDDKDSLNIINLLKKPELKEMDLMIGPLYGSSFMPVAKFARDNSIPIVSPFTQINKILFDNLYVCKMLPSTAMQIELMANYVVDTFNTQNIILVNNGNSKEVTFFNTFKKIASRALIKAGHTANDSLKEVRNVPQIESLLSTSKTNVIILPSNNQSYVTEILSKLYTIADKDKHKIVVFGLQSWLNYDNLDFVYLNKLSVHLPANSYIDYKDPSTQTFIKNYREKFKTEPELYAYQGFDIAYYFISTLQKYGSGFLNNIVDNKSKGLEIDFNFMQYPLDSGFENKFVYILKYQDNQLLKAN
jgi:LysM repeat protein/ABC-type branched-subunit amino acid transport system substrate-binding protein